MKKIGIYLFYGGALVFIGILIYAGFGLNKKSDLSNADASETKISTQANNSTTAQAENLKPAQKVQVYVFHATNRCYSCVTMGKYTQATLDNYFKDELETGKIEFREINVDLAENKEVVAKFKAAGTSLFINAIIDGQDNIKEEVQAWRLLGDEQSFSGYLSQKIRKMIGEKASARAEESMEKEDEGIEDSASFIIS